jgi:hypothetical protein
VAYVHTLKRGDYTSGIKTSLTEYSPNAAKSKGSQRESLDHCAGLDQLFIKVEYPALLMPRPVRDTEAISSCYFG